MIFNPKKSLGQNFLIDDKILNKIIEIGNVNFENVVIEVGPGNGALTSKIFDEIPEDVFVGIPIVDGSDQINVASTNFNYLTQNKPQ